MSSNIVIIRYRGKFIKVKKNVHETQNRAFARAWYIAKNCNDSMSDIEKECLSQLYVNEKYMNNKYVIQI